MVASSLGYWAPEAVELALHYIGDSLGEQCPCHSGNRGLDVSQRLGGLLKRETHFRKWQNKNASGDMRKETGKNRESAAERLLMVREGAGGERTRREAWGR